jgi:hypothetical protein
MNHAAYIVIGSVLFIGVTWLVTMNSLAWAGGWQRLASAYPAPPNWHGRHLRAFWIKVGWVDYNGCLSYGVDTAGLRIALWPIFSTGHAPLYIPWTEMRVEAVTKQFGRRGQVVRLAVGNPLVARICVPEAVFALGREVIERGPQSQYDVADKAAP